MELIIEVSTSYGKVVAKPMELIDITDVQPMADEESINNSGESKSDKTDPAEVAPKSITSTQEDSSI